MWRAAWNVPLSIVDRSNSFVGTGTWGHPRSKLFVFVECRVLVFKDHGFVLSGILCCHASHVLTVANIPMILTNTVT